MSLERNTRSVFDAVRSIEVVGAHAKADEHLADLECRKVIAYSNALETAAHVFYKACSLERVYT